MEKAQDIIYTIKRGTGPLVATAIHDGHETRKSITDLFSLTSDERSREEDPYTASFARVASNQIIGLRSRFEVDLNREEAKAVYQKPEDAWGLHVWKDKLPKSVIAESLRLYRDFYEKVEAYLQEIIDIYGYVVVYDLHSYNHRRKGPEAPFDDPAKNPDINIGTAGLDLNKWRPVVEKFKQTMHSYNFPKNKLDVRENVKFDGGYFMRWIHQRFGNRACVLAIEFKKIFMDEWTGKLDRLKFFHLKEALESTIEPVKKEAKVQHFIPSTV